MLAYSPAHTNGILVHPQSLAQQSTCTAAHVHGLHPGHPSHTLQPAPDNTPRTAPERPCLTSYSPPAVSAIANSKRPAPVLVDSSIASALSHTIRLAPRYANCITCFPTASMPPPATCSRSAAALSLCALHPPAFTPRSQSCRCPPTCHPTTPADPCYLHPHHAAVHATPMKSFPLALKSLEEEKERGSFLREQGECEKDLGEDKKRGEFCLLN